MQNDPENQPNKADAVNRASLIDITSAILDKARRRLQAMGLTNVEWKRKVPRRQPLTAIANGQRPSEDFVGNPGLQRGILSAPAKRFNAAPMRFLVTPDLRIESVLELSPDRVRQLGLDVLLLDVDGTLKNYRAETLRPEVVGWLDSLRAAGIGLCLLSNGRSGRIGRIAQQVGLPFVSQACKPLPFGCIRAMRRLGFGRGQTGVVGDQLFADVMAARLAGVTSILVRPIHPEEEPWFTRLKRPAERVLLRDMPSGD
jgi:uncharacterized protein